jgi:hypothetical protein
MHLYTSIRKEVLTMPDPKDPKQEQSQDEKEREKQGELRQRARDGDENVEYVEAPGEPNRPELHDNGGRDSSDEPAKNDYQAGEEADQDRPAEGKFEEKNK